MSIERFMAVYVEALRSAVAKYPAEYPWARSLPGETPASRPTVEEVSVRMGEAIKRGSYNKEGHAIKATCKALRIPYTYKAINAYVARRARCTACGSAIKGFPRVRFSHESTKFEVCEKCYARGD